MNYLFRIFIQNFYKNSPYWLNIGVYMLPHQTKWNIFIRISLNELQCLVHKGLSSSRGFGAMTPSPVDQSLITFDKYWPMLFRNASQEVEMCKETGVPGGN